MQSANGNNSSEQDLMNCMEVRGGYGGTANFFRRPGLDVWIWSQSRDKARIEGGEMHYISSCASGRITRTLMADVGGIGSLFTDVAGRMRDLMAKNVNVIAQNSAVKQMASNLGDASRQGGFASTVLSTFFAPTQSMTICNAGHPPPLIYRAAEDQWTVLKTTPNSSSTVGEESGTVSPDEYQRFKLKMSAGDMVLSYSNALTECRYRDGRIIGIAGLLELARILNKVECGDVGGARNVLEDFVDRLRQENEENMRDDEATMILSVATRVRVALRDNLLAPFRLFGRVSDRTQFGTE